MNLLTESIHNSLKVSKVELIRDSALEAEGCFHIKLTFDYDADGDGITEDAEFVVRIGELNTKADDHIELILDHESLEIAYDAMCEPSVYARIVALIRKTGYNAGNVKSKRIREQKKTLKHTFTQIISETEETPIEDETTRILSFNKTKINEKLKEICEVSSLTAIPLKGIKAVLSEFKLKLKEEKPKFIRKDGNVDLELVNEQNKTVSNAKLTIFWKKETSGFITVNGYLS